MADPKNKAALNVPGSFYVDDQCIACDACVNEAPQFFAMNDEAGHAYVKKQPITEADIKDCENALNCCPVEAIGNNGQ